MVGISLLARMDDVEAGLIMEIAEGIHRIESDLGERFMCQYVIAGGERALLVDTGLADTPSDVIVPYLSRAGLEPDVVLISHADNDHVGGNRAFRDAHPNALYACHENDRRWVESNEALVRENYGWHAEYGFPPMDAGELLASMSGDSSIDVGLRGGETIRLDADRRVEVLHLPGHTLGHLGLWDERTRAAIIIDAVLADGIYDRAGNKRVDAALGPFPQFMTELEQPSATPPTSGRASSRPTA
jgi:glyoxylase-like metal-dependent hydrolase (beta-lactamase superfamily II)